MRIEVVGADTISQQARTYAEYRVFAALTRVRGCRESPGGSRRAALSGPWSRLRQHRLQRDGCIGGSRLHSDTSNRSPRLRSDQPRGRAYKNPRQRRDWSQTPFPCEAYRRQRPCATASCPVRCPVTDGVRYSTPAAE